MSLAFAFAVCLVAVVFSIKGMDKEGTITALKVTARFSFCLFWPAYAGSAVAILFGPRFAPIKRYSRHFGVAFASAQLVHLGTVIWLCWIGATPPAFDFIIFGVAAAFTYILALISIDQLHKILTSMSGRILRIVGLNYIAFVFAFDFLHSPNGIAGQTTFYLPFSILAVAGPVLRLAAFISLVQPKSIDLRYANSAQENNVICQNVSNKDNPNLIA